VQLGSLCRVELVWSMIISMRIVMTSSVASRARAEQVEEAFSALARLHDQAQTP
jgi:hypothetical protein